MVSTQRDTGGGQATPASEPPGRALNPLPPFPSGWFAVCEAAEVPAGRVVTRRLCGAEVVVFRTFSGRVAVSDPHCPHLGAHLGHGGCVTGETLRCPFHGFRFDAEGACVDTGYGGRLPKIGLATWPARERFGLVFAYYDPQRREPSWELPVLDASDHTDYSRANVELQCHAQEVAENGVDLGHFGPVHGYTLEHATREFESGGPNYRMAYQVTRPLLRHAPAQLRIGFEVRLDIWGLGCSLVEATVPALGAHLRQYICSTPIARGETLSRLGLCLRRSTGPGAAVRDRAVQAFAMHGFVKDFEQDRVMWNNKVYLAPPGLAEGDGPIGAYRRWCQQFYA